MVETTLRESCIPFRKPKNKVRAMIATIIEGIGVVSEVRYFTPWEVQISGAGEGARELMITGWKDGLVTDIYCFYPYFVWLNFHLQISRKNISRGGGTKSNFSISNKITLMFSIIILIENIDNIINIRIMKA